MNHPAELALHQYMENAVNGKSTMSAETIQQVGLDVMGALGRQFGGGNKRGEFGLRMSNVGRPTCQLWFEKNKPEEALPLPTTFVMNMMLGDIVEAVFKGLLKEAGVQYEDDKKVTLVLDDDLKPSASHWATRPNSRRPHGILPKQPGWECCRGKRPLVRRMDRPGEVPTGHLETVPRHRWHGSPLHGDRR